MRRCFAIFLLALQPLQFSWAAVAAYCGHESDAQAQHLGHHEHSHAGATGIVSDVEPADPQGEGPAAPDFDCGHCHNSGCSMPALVGTLMPPAATSHPVASVEGIVRTRAHNPPERPQWLRFGTFQVGPGTKAVAIVSIAGKAVGTVRFALK